jgi:hypothetical protein
VKFVCLKGTLNVFLKNYAFYTLSFEGKQKGIRAYCGFSPGEIVKS